MGVPHGPNTTSANRHKSTARLGVPHSPVNPYTPGSAAVPHSPKNPYTKSADTQAIPARYSSEGGSGTSRSSGAGSPGTYNTRSGSSGSYSESRSSDSGSERRYRYKCEINDDQDDAGGVCNYYSGSRREAGDKCKCSGQRGTVQ